jgi:hypothetical protein
MVFLFALFLLDLQYNLFMVNEAISVKTNQKNGNNFFAIEGQKLKELVFGLAKIYPVFDSIYTQAEYFY